MTFKQKKAALLADLRALGWHTKSDLKVPHATSPDRRIRLWFRAQAVYVGYGITNSNDARSLTSDMRLVRDGEQLARMAQEGFGHGSMQYIVPYDVGRAAGKVKRIRVQRDGYLRSAYYRKDGTHVRAAQIPATTFLENDPGRPGRRARGSKVGPYKNAPKWIRRPGMLGGHGYAQRSERERHALLRSSLEMDGYTTTVRRLYVLLRPVALKPATRRVVQADIAWLKRLVGKS